MKLVFSESTPDYARYTFPCVIWAYPEPGETPADLFEAGFLPSSPALDRFYYCRQLRVPLREWDTTSENRRVLRKGAGIDCELIERAAVDFSPARRSFWLSYAEKKFGPGVMPETRLDRLMSSPVISHVLLFHHRPTGREIGAVLLYLEPPRVGFYYFAFYDLEFPGGNLGMYMMTRAIEFFARKGFRNLHLGTCYNERALYKAQFEPVEFTTGWGWSRDVDVLKSLVRQAPRTGHLLEDREHPAAQLASGSNLLTATPYSLKVGGTTASLPPKTPR